MKAIETKARKIKLFVLFTSLLLSIAFLYSCESDIATKEQSSTLTEETTVKKEASKSFKFDIDKTLFIGDSNIFHLSTYGLVPTSQILTGSEYYMTLDPSTYKKYIVFPETKEEMTVGEAVGILKPEYIIITLGTDGAATLDKNGFELSYSLVIESIKRSSPESVIGVQSIFPVCMGTKDVRFKDPDKTNEKFSLANVWLKSLAEKHGVAYLDTSSVLSDANGSLKSEYNTDHLDGYHLNREGLEVMLEYIKAFESTDE